jgi:2-polyprenyl-3-methyl-5-hydroxy-6-metoxy-1,4-benzoquinol methylase
MKNSGRFLEQIENIFNTRYPYFKTTIDRQLKEFGPSWRDFLEQDLECFFGEDVERFEKAVEGYGRFALEAMKLQVEFNKTREYRAKTYEEVADEVYQNRDYMFDLYLPGILLSHFLWRHHYKQHIFFMEKFVPLIEKNGGKLFYDVGVGTGFYSKEMLRTNPDMKGVGFDLSRFSMDYTISTLEAFGYTSRYEGRLIDIVANKVDKQAPFIINIEVLEHLEDPQAFIFALFRMLEPGGYGLISAAITAPNADHIYLYKDTCEVVEQLENAGFIIVDQTEDFAYTPKKSTDSVPRNAAFIVTKQA